MDNKHLKRCSTPLVIREMQIKTTMRCHFTPTRMAKFKKTGNKCYKDAGKLVPSYIAYETIKWCNYFEKQFGTSSIKVNMGASLVAQWLRICLLMQGTRVRALVWEDPTCRGAAGPVSHNYWACASGACAPQQERPRWWEARAPWWRVASACHNWRKPSHRDEDPTQP